MKPFVLLVVCAICSVGYADSFAPIAPDATVDQVLDALKVRGETLGGFTANVSMTRTDQVTATNDAESGKIVYQQSAPGTGRVRVTFLQRKEDKKIFTENHDYSLADGKLVDQDNDKKKADRKQVVKPGDKINLFQLGDGPFPLPIGQKREDVLRDFDVKLVPADKDNDPSNSVHLSLKPKAETKLARKFAQIDVWADRKTGMPVRIVSADADGQATQTVELKDANLDAQLSDKDFELPATGPGWDVVEEPYRP